MLQMGKMAAHVRMYKKSKNPGRGHLGLNLVFIHLNYKSIMQLGYIYLDMVLRKVSLTAVGKSSLGAN